MNVSRMWGRCPTRKGRAEGVLVCGDRFRLGFLCLNTNCLNKPIFGFQLMAELLRVQAIVMPFQLQQFCVRTLFGDLAILDHNDAIGAPNGGSAMRDHERGASLHQGFHASLDERFGQRIHAGGGFVHDEQFRTGEHSSCQTDELLLPN